MAVVEHPVDLALGVAAGRAGRVPRLNSPKACELHWLPESLLNCATSSVALDFHRLKWCLPQLPDHLRVAVYEKLFSQGRLCQVGYEWCELEAFAAVLRVPTKRYEVHQIFQALLDHGLRLGEVLVTSYSSRCATFLSGRKTVREMETTVDLGFALGRFLSEAGWYLGCEKCIKACFDLLKNVLHPSGELWNDMRRFECYFWLMDAYNGFCRYTEAMDLYKLSKPLAEKLEKSLSDRKDPDGLQINLSELYIQYSLLFFYTGNYEQSLDWAIKALKYINKFTPVKTVIEVCRQASKVLVVRRQFKQAQLLIHHAVSLSRWHFDGAKRMPAALLDFGFYLMNVDQTEAAVKMYQMGLDYRQAQFGGNNLKVAQAYEDLAYALYVQEYSSGDFRRANEHAVKAVDISKLLLPENHLLLASCRRVKALILEEIAIDSHDKSVESVLLAEAEELHLSALTLCKRVFGDHNVQTAKHYGNLARLYQSMRRLEEAEQMHKKAISIKEQVLGVNDYEVALSIGHLASLYNYDMERYAEAEKLYLRSIEIGKHLFGLSYSGLEYDYRGLAHAYVALGRADQAMEYVAALQHWKTLRDNEQNNRNVEAMWQSLANTPHTSHSVIDEFLKKYN